MLSEQYPDSMGQLTALTSGALSMTYAYSSSQNNGKITGQTDNMSGEQVVYAYDALNRLASAAATRGSWGQSYGYDGFGNLQTQTVTAGSAPSLSVVYNASNNLQTTDCADANGNIWGNTTGGGSCGTLSPTYSYDASNRILTAAGGVQYGYAPGNKRVWKGITTGGNLSTDVITFWSVTGQKLGDYNVSGDPSVLYDWVDYDTPAPIVTAALGTANYYFGHKQIAKGGTYVGTDRLGSFGKYYPWGQEKPSATTNGTEKFTGYFRDAETGLDYAKNRYHQPGMGRFMTPDRKRRSAHPKSPGSWNRYAYTRGDPVNRTDRLGLEDECTDDGDCDESDSSNTYCDDNEESCDDGGGGNEEPQNIYKQLSQTTQTSLLNNALESALELLEQPGCTLALFNGVQPGQLAPAQVLQNLYTSGNITYGYIGDNSTGATTVPLVTATPDDPNATPSGVVTLNDNLYGLWDMQSAAQEAVTLIHELGHVYAIMYGAGSTAISADNSTTAAGIAASGANQSLITQKCLNQ
jgi:RHS repeat-associated protein